MPRTEQKTELSDIKACVLHLNKKLNLINYPRKHCIFFCSEGAEGCRDAKGAEGTYDGCIWAQRNA